MSASAPPLRFIKTIYFDLCDFAFEFYQFVLYNIKSRWKHDKQNYGEKRLATFLDQNYFYKISRVGNHFSPTNCDILLYLSN